MNKIIALVACSLMVSYSFAQKRPLDIKACSQWNRIDDAKLSPTGRYVTYKIVPIEQGFDEICNIPTILYDNKNKGKRIDLGNVENIYYFNSDKQLYYTKTDSTGTTLTYVVDLPSGNKRLWKYPESLEPIKGVNLSASRLHIDEDKDKNIKSRNNLIILKSATPFPKCYLQKRNGLLIRKTAIKSSRPFHCAYHPLTP